MCAQVTAYCGECFTIAFDDAPIEHYGPCPALARAAAFVASVSDAVSAAADRHEGADAVAGGLDMQDVQRATVARVRRAERA